MSTSLQCVLRAASGTAASPAGAFLLCLSMVASGGCKSSESEKAQPVSYGTFVAVRGVDFRTDEWIASIAIGDFDEDGKPDVAAASGVGDLVTVLRGGGDGTFTRAASVPTGTGPGWGIAVADLDGDHHLDLAVANAGSSTVSIHRGHGDGTFGAATAFDTGAFPVAVVLRDLNGDSKLDLVTVNVNGGSVSVLLGKGDGTFLPRIDTPAGTAPAAFAIGDVNGDGKLDLVVADYVAGGIRVLLGIGDGSFTQGGAASTGAGAYSVALADLNGDGKLDVAVAYRESARVSVLLGKGDGTFGTPTDLSTSDGVVWVALVDVNGDGRRDLVMLTRDGYFTALPGAGDGSFKSAPSQTEGVWAPRTAAVADLDGDGMPDVVVVNDKYPYDPPAAPGAMPALGAFYSVGALLDVGALPLVVSPLRTVALRGEAPIAFSATVAGKPRDVAWTLSPPLGTLSRSSGPTVDYTPPSSAGPLQEVWLTASGGGATARASIRVTALVAHPLGSTGAPNGFVEYLPPGYGDGTPRPLLVTLHGSCGQGNGTTDLLRVVGCGPDVMLIAGGQWPNARPFVVLAPQQPSSNDCMSAQDIVDFVSWATAHYTVDPKSVFLTGWSCGAIGIWTYLGFSTDTQVAAAVLVAGAPVNGYPGASPCNMGRVALWALHGDQDTVVPFAGEQSLVGALAVCPSPPRRDLVYTVVPGAGHGVVFPVVDGSLGADVYSWLLAHAKP